MVLDTEDAWTNYDVFTAHGIAKGATIYVVMENQNGGTDVTMGVRTDGSGLERKVLVHEAEAGGSSCLMMPVTVDASTGLIEYYVSQTANVVFTIIAYFTGTVFTELWQDVSAAVNATWRTVQITGAPASKTCHFCLLNTTATADNNLGVRTDNDAINRYIYEHEAEGAGAGEAACFGLHSKTDAAGEIQSYASTIATHKIYCDGYYDANIDYVERAPLRLNLGANGWVATDLSANMDEDARVVDLTVGHFDISGEHLTGARVNGSALLRYFLMHETEGGGTNRNTMLNLPTRTDASGVVELYTDDSASDRIDMWGYFTFEADAPPAGQQLFTLINMEDY
jgi:hypothetical protein